MVVMDADNGQVAPEYLGAVPTLTEYGLQALLGTRPGQQLLRPGYGLDLRHYVDGSPDGLEGAVQAAVAGLYPSGAQVSLTFPPAEFEILVELP